MSREFTTAYGQIIDGIDEVEAIANESSSDEAQNSDVEMKSSNAPVGSTSTTAQSSKKAQTPGRSSRPQRSSRRGMAGAAGGGSKDFGAGSWGNAGQGVALGATAWETKIVDQDYWKGQYPVALCLARLRRKASLADFGDPFLPDGVQLPAKKTTETTNGNNTNASSSNGTK